MPDDPTIPDEADVWRLVLPLWMVPGDNGVGVRPSTAAFDDSSDGDPMSAILARSGRDPRDVVPATSPDAGVVAFSARFLRDAGMELERAPVRAEPDHILVRGRKTKSVRKKLVRGCRWVVEGKRAST